MAGLIKPKELVVAEKRYLYYNINDLEKLGGQQVQRLPYSIKVLLEAAVRNYDGHLTTKEHVNHLSNWIDGHGMGKEIPFQPTRIVMQDFTGVPAIVDLAAMRSAMVNAGKDPQKINPLIPVDIIIDHSVMVDISGTEDALDKNVQFEFERNLERYQLIKWAQESFENFNVIPPSVGIIHQVNLEYLATLVSQKETPEGTFVFPDSLVGTDSHTTMINGLSILGWGVGGIEAEACMLGQPLFFLTPEVVGVKLTGKLSEGVTATDLALTITELLRKHHVVGKFVEFFGEGVHRMSLADRATVANMAPEYGATMGFFPVDEETLRYLENTGRDRQLIDLAREYYKAVGMFCEEDSTEAIYSVTIELDLSTVYPCMAGPKRPQDRVDLQSVQKEFHESLIKPIGQRGYGLNQNKRHQQADIFWEDGTIETMRTGAVTIAAITSCTNTSNPSVMIGAGLIAQKAVQLSLKKPRYVKASLTPGSRVVTNYLEKAGVLKDLESLGFYVTGYGCGTCIGNSGPLEEPVSKIIDEQNLLVASVLSGNRNFEGRVHSKVKANYLASPMLVVIYALAGTVDIDLLNDPIAYTDTGKPVFLNDLWPSNQEIEDLMSQVISKEIFQEEYSNINRRTSQWDEIQVKSEKVYAWNRSSTYIKEPPFFHNQPKQLQSIHNIKGARILAVLGDSITTDHISPAGSIPAQSPAGQFLIAQGINSKDFNSYGARRGNHEVMMRGTFANVRINNLLAKGKEGGYTTSFLTHEVQPIYDVAMQYQEQGTPLIILAGKEYGTGSSRDWAAKGTILLGVKAVIAESYERIHRSNLVGMGVLPLQFEEGQSYFTLGLTGEEVFTINGLGDSMEPLAMLQIIASNNNQVISFNVRMRIDNPVELAYYRHGGILNKVLKDMLDE